MSVLRTSIMLTLKEVWGKMLGSTNWHNKTVSSFEFNGNLIVFLGLNDNPDKAFGFEADLYILNETIFIPKPIYKELNQRRKEGSFIIADYNPVVMDSWVYDLEKRPDHIIFRTNIFDNKHANQQAKKEILMYAHPAVDDWHIVERYQEFTKQAWEKFKENNVSLNTASIHDWMSKGLGLRSSGDDIIFKNVRWCSSVPSVEDCINSGGFVNYGIDFGITGDPTVLVRVSKHHSNLYIEELVYESGITEEDLASRMIERGWIPKDYELVIADDHGQQQRLIQIMNQMGVSVLGCEMGSGSVSITYKLLSRLNIYILQGSDRVYQDFTRHSWARLRNGDYKLDGMGGKVPINKHKHGVDATRYAATYFDYTV